VPISINHLLALDWKTWVCRNNPVDASPVSIFAFSDNVTTQNKTLWDGLPVVWQHPTTATTLSIVTTATTADTGGKILVSGLDSNWDAITESVTLNGVTPVVTTNSFIRVNGLSMTAPASGGTTNVGTITAKHNSITYAQINPLIGKTQAGIYSVPNGYTLFVYSVDCYSGDAGSGTNYVTFNVSVTPNASPTPVTFDLLQTTWLESFSVQRIVPQIQYQKTDIEWQFKVNSGTQSVSLIVQGMLLKNAD
jgi:hypothetical protein